MTKSNGGRIKRKAIQIAVSVDTDNRLITIALANDGTMWELVDDGSHNSWRQMPDLPGSAPSTEKINKDHDHA